MDKDKKEQTVSRRQLLKWGSGGLVAATGLASLGTRFFQAPQRSYAEAASTNAVIQWNSLMLQAVRASKPAPPIVARALAVLHTCMYDAWAPYDAHANTTQQGNRLRRPADEHTTQNKLMAVSYAAYKALVDLFPTYTNQGKQLLSSLGYNPDDTSNNTTSPIGIGNRATATVLAFRHTDGANQLGDLHPGAYSDYTGYQPVNTFDTFNNPGHWQPLRVPDGKGGFIIQSFAVPQWSKVTPFALTSGSQFRPSRGPATYPSNLYREQAENLVHISAGLNDREKVIAEYWKDGPFSEQPPGHWCLFGQFVSWRDQHNLDDDVKMFFLLANALFDSSVACWDCKRFYDSERPISAINFLYKGQKIYAWAGPNQGSQWINGEDWRPYQPDTFVTPAFAEFSSGHSTFSAAGAEILRRFTKSDLFLNSHTIPAGSSAIEKNTPSHDIELSWNTFSDAANEAGISRRFGGIHFEQGDLGGRTVGRKIGQTVWEKGQSYIHGII